MVYINNIFFLYVSESDENIDPLAAIFLLLFLYGLPLAYESYKKYNWPKEGKVGQPLPNKVVFDAINSIWGDKTFIDEFRYILYDEGNINEFIKDIQIETYRGRIWLIINSKDFKPPIILNTIIERITITKQFHNQILKYTLTDQEIDDFKKLLLYILINKEFFNVLKEHIINNKEFKLDDDVLKLDYDELNRKSLKINPWEILGPTRSAP
jgi:hypothetical protein